MSRSEALVRKLCTVLCTSLTRTPDWRFACWLQTPLPLNNYWHLVREQSRPLQSNAADEHDTKRRRLAAPMPARAQPDTVAASSRTTAPLVSVRVSMDQRAALTSVTMPLADEQALLLRSLEDASRRHFDHSQPGVIPKLTQLLLVVALEPCDLALDFVLHKRVDNEFVARNFLLRSNENVAPGDAGAWARDVKRASFNIFRRFPELAIVCTAETDIEQLRAIQHLWCIADQVFQRCDTTLHSESTAEFRYNHILGELLADRSELLVALATANIYAAGIDAGHFGVRRDLFESACVCALLHVVHLHACAPHDSPVARRLAKSIQAFKRVRIAIAALTPVKSL